MLCSPDMPGRPACFLRKTEGRDVDMREREDRGGDGETGRQRDRHTDR